MSRAGISRFEMSLVYAAVTMALEVSKMGEGSSCLAGRLDSVSSLLSQAGYEVEVVRGWRKGCIHSWLEVGIRGKSGLLIVDISQPKLPHKTVLRKGSSNSTRYQAAFMQPESS